MSRLTAFGEADRPAVGTVPGSRTSWPGLIEAFRDRLPVTYATPVVTLYEGGTPLLCARELSARTGCEVYLKVEGANPTGSFKDRGMIMAVSKAAEAGARAVICASTGNTSGRRAGTPRGSACR
jgi:threonine synthase